MLNEVKKRIHKNIIKRKIQLYAFILLGVIGLGLIITVIFCNLPVKILLALIPIALMMKKNVQMWDLYNDLVILQKFIHDDEFRDEYTKEHLNK